MSGTDGSLRLVGHGLAELPAAVDLQPTASGAWTTTGLKITLPEAGTYQLDAMVRAYLQGTSPVTASISARLWDETAGAVVPRSELWVNQIGISAPAGIVTGAQNTASLHAEYAVPAARVLRLEAARTNFLGSTTTAGVASNTDGRTMLRFSRIA